MSKGTSLPYHLRPNKAVDRELFLALLARLDPVLTLKGYRYYGLGGPFLGDFRMIHTRLGIDRMTCIEVDEKVHRRQKFNSPFHTIVFEHDTFENFLDSNYMDEPAIVWLDYTKPKALATQIARFAKTCGSVPLGSVVRLTLNANPVTLGDPPAEELSVEVEGDVSVGRDKRPTKLEWRFLKFKERLGGLVPSEVTANGMGTREYGRSLLVTVKVAVEKEKLSHGDRKIVWAFATHYADGQAMVTATVVVTPFKDIRVAGVVQSWDYYSSMEDPHVLDMPSLSMLERITMESKSDARDVMDCELPEGNLVKDPFSVFKKYYRICPHFSRVEW